MRPAILAAAHSTPYPVETLFVAWCGREATLTGNDKVVIRNHFRVGYRWTIRVPVRIGNYRVTTTLTAFADATRNGVPVSVGQTVTVNLQMAPSGLQESVTVTGEAPPSTSRLRASAATSGRLAWTCGSRNAFRLASEYSLQNVIREAELHIRR